MQHAISWFEIPATNLERAQAFYEAIFGIRLMPMDFPNIRMRAFPVEDPQHGVGGAIVDSGGFHRPSATEGPLVYLNANPDLQPVLNRLSGEGGQVIMEKTLIDEQTGYMAFFIDTEGNRIGLHSQG